MTSMYDMTLVKIKKSRRFGYFQGEGGGREGRGAHQETASTTNYEKM